MMPSFSQNLVAILNISITAIYFIRNANSLTYPITDTNQTKGFNSVVEIVPPSNEGADYYGQDANYEGREQSFVDNGDYTISKSVTGLMWTSGADGTGASRMTWSEGIAMADTLNAASYLGYTDWRVPSVKELYSLMQFSGQDASTASSSDGLTAFVDTDYFEFDYGVSPSWRLIDAQYITSTEYVGTVMSGLPAFFGVNFADGRIKGYQSNGTTQQYYAFYVRSNEDYGENLFSADGNVVKDYATGLMWMRNDTGGGKNWKEALKYCESLELNGEDDWRLPNAKELQSIVDYSRSPSTTNSAAINPVFNITPITNELGETDWPYFWSSTTHEDSSGTGGSGVYFSFGKSLGYYNGKWQDVHGAGAQKSDPKAGDPDDYPTGNGPQGDAVRIYNGVRCVRDFNTTATSVVSPSATSASTSAPTSSVPTSGPTSSPTSPSSSATSAPTPAPTSDPTSAPTSSPTSPTSNTEERTSAATSIEGWQRGNTVSLIWILFSCVLFVNVSRNLL